MLSQLVTFIQFSEDIGVRDEDFVWLQTSNIAGDAKLKISLNDLKQTVTLAQRARSANL